MKSNHEQAGMLWYEVRKIAHLHTGLDGAIEQVLRTNKYPIIQGDGGDKYRMVSVEKTKAKELVKLFDKNQHELVGTPLLATLWLKRSKGKEKPSVLSGSEAISQIWLKPR